MHTRIAVGLAAIALAFAAVAAQAVPRPVAPRDGATVRTSSPVLRWELPATEDAEEISLARVPRLRTDGSFTTDVIIASSALAPNAEQWTPVRPLWAGNYWWQVESSERASSARRFSDPSSFTIPIALRVMRLFAPRDRSSVTVRWRGNVARARITVRMFSGDSVVWTASKVSKARAPNRVVSASFRIPARYVDLRRRATFRVAIAARVSPRG